MEDAKQAEVLSRQFERIVATEASAFKKWLIEAFPKNDVGRLKKVLRKVLGKNNRFKNLDILPNMANTICNDGTPQELKSMTIINFKPSIVLDRIFMNTETVKNVLIKPNVQKEFLTYIKPYTGCKWEVIEKHNGIELIVTVN